MIKPGDTVFLKSGGPELTVGEISTFGKFATCHYYNRNKFSDSESGYFTEHVIPVAALELSNPQE